jgi:hypothetical protein
LGDDGLNLSGVLDREAEAGGGAVIEDVDAVLGRWVGKLGEEGVDGGCDVGEGVVVVFGDCGEAVCWEIGGDDTVMGR